MQKDTVGALIIFLGLGGYIVVDGSQRLENYLAEQSKKNGTPSSEQFIDSSGNKSQIFSSQKECEAVTKSGCRGTSSYPRKKE
jgi:hypothetical protein